jgi:hypothetical protein
MPEIHVTIADIPIEIHSPLSAAQLGIEERLGPFFGEPKSAAGPVSLQWKTSEAPSPKGELIFDPGSIWQMYRSAQGYDAAWNYMHHSIQAVLSANPTWDDLILTEKCSGPDWRSLLNLGAGELLLRTRILFSAGLVFHASGLDDNGHGVVFVGHSGAGKSTQVGLWGTLPGVVAMNDDRIAIRLTEQGAIAYGTPWGGTADIARNHQVPLTVILVLEQAPENELQPLSPTVALPLLIARTFIPYWDRELMQRALSNLDAIAAQVPIYRLRCRPEIDVVPLVRSLYATLNHVHRR